MVTPVFGKQLGFEVSENIYRSKIRLLLDFFQYEKKTEDSGYTLVNNGGRSWFYCEFLTIFILMDFPMHVVRISIDCPFCILRGHGSKFLNYDLFMSSHMLPTPVPQYLGHRQQ